MIKKIRSNEVYAWQVMSPAVFVIYPDQNLDDAVKIMRLNRCPALPVVDKHNNLLGIISYNHIFERLQKKQKLDIKVPAIMQSDNLPVINEDDVLDLENMNEITCVCDKRILKGIIYQDSVIQFYSARAKMLDDFEKLSKQYEMILNNCYDSIFVTDGQGEVIWVNASSERITGSYGQAFGKNVNELESKIFFPSATNMVLKQRKTRTVLQEVASGAKVVVTSNPVFDDSGNIIMVVTVTRNIEELIKDVEEFIKTKELEEVHARLDETKRLSQKYYSELQELRKERLAEQQIITHNQKMKRIIALSKNVASVDSTVLILGESGVGKDVIAKLIHGLSDRKEGPFIKINCGAIPETLLESELFGYEAGAFTGARKKRKLGLIEIADGGTLFLDEVAELSLNLQVKLLQVIQEKTFIRLGDTNERKVDIRIIAATNKDIKAMVRDGKFREDLFYRLNVVQISILPLRERKEDIIPLTMFFMNKFNKMYNRNKQLSSKAMDYLLKYRWPGNIRELENLIECIVVTGEQDIISPEDLPNDIFEIKEQHIAYSGDEDIVPLREALEKLEAKLIDMAYKEYKSTTKAAAALGINQSTVVRKMKKYGV